MEIKNLLITGANGFIGRTLVSKLASEQKYSVWASVRKKTNQFPSRVEIIEYADITRKSNLTSVLRNIDAVVHLVARVHVMNEKASNTLFVFRNINVNLTVNLAKQAASHGVKRFVFLSSVKVNGELTFHKPFRESDLPKPEDAYAISKWEAEEALRKISKDTGMEVVIIRSPLVYGPNVKANFLKLTLSYRCQ